MKLNCKPGQLAIKVKADSGDKIPIGSIVRCIKHGAYIRADSLEIYVAWEVEFRSSIRSGAGNLWGCRDSYLRPIRDSDGEDETLTWAGKPEKKEKETVE